MYRVRLEGFEGPLDLLLFFIRRDELDIHDIPIARIADEYLAYVRVLDEIDLDGAADFIYMAALLITIKAKMLLPRTELDEEGEPVDPRRELVERLLEYVRFKEAAGRLDGLHEARHQLFARGAASDERSRLAPPPEETYRASVFDLVGALRSVLDRATEEPVRHALSRYDYTMEEQQEYVLGRAAGRPTSFLRLVTGQPRAFVIVTFLAVLELLRRQAIRLVEGLTADDFSVETTVAAPLAPALA